MNIKINKKEINHIDITNLKKISLNQNDWLEPGISEYKLYAYLSLLFDNKYILDIGTRVGNSALAFSYNKNNKVISYDVVEQGASVIKKSNIEFKVQNFIDDLEINFDEVYIIMIDIDPHDAKQEKEYINKLKQKNWRGLLILDDIGSEWNEMNKFWNNIEDEKYDLTDVGHKSGTGIINFGKKFKIEIIN